jgi:hypothetical protein
MIYGSGYKKEEWYSNSLRKESAKYESIKGPSVGQRIHQGTE